MEAKSISEEKDISTSTDLRPRSFFRVWGDWGLATLKFFGKKLHSPMGIYFIFTWLISVIVMGVTNTMRGDGPEHSFWKGPSYWMTIFLTYGLNTGQDITLRLIGKPVMVWFFAPMVTLLLGFSLFMLTDSGFLKNGFDLVAENDFAQTHRYFSIDEVWGQELINPNSPKWVLTYIVIVWLPVLLGAVITGLYNFIIFKLVLKKPYLPSVKLLLIIVFIASLVLGTTMALMTGDIELRFRDLLYSLFVERRSNNFLIYGFAYQDLTGNQGQYHPIAISLTCMLIYFIPFLITYGIFLIIGNLDNIWKNKDYLYRKVSDYVEARRAPSLDLGTQAEE